MLPAAAVGGDHSDCWLPTLGARWLLGLPKRLNLHLLLSPTKQTNGEKRRKLKHKPGQKRAQTFSGGIRCSWWRRGREGGENAPGMGPSHFSHFPVYVDFIIETRRRATPATSAKLWRPTVCATGPSQQHMKQARGEGTRGGGRCW